MFVGMETALRAIQAHRASLDVREQNAANASTPGYARERVSMRSAALSGRTLWSKNGGVLLGVSAGSVERLSDGFLDGEARKAAGAHARWNEAERVLSGVESMVGGPSDPGVEEAFDAFWASLQDLSMNPESMSARAVVVQRAEAFGDAVKKTREFIVSSRQALGDRIGALVEDVNSAAAEIAKLNGEIARANAAGRSAPHLLDRRDYLLDRLAEIAGAVSVEQKGGAVSVLVGNTVLVSGEAAGELRAEGLDIVNVKTGSAVKLSSGTLAGALESAAYLGSLIEKLDDATAGLISAFNDVHRRGYGLDGSTGNDFFSGSGAADIAVARVVKEHPEKIAASLSPDGLPGDQGNVLELLRMLDEAPVSGNPFREAYRALVSDLGTASANAKASLDTAKAVRDHAERQRDQVRGISLDEETVGMVEHQRALEASARYITVLDEAVKAVLEMGAR